MRSQSFAQCDTDGHKDNTLDLQFNEDSCRILYFKVYYYLARLFVRIPSA